MIRRRSFVTGLCGLVSAPALVSPTSLMPVKVVRPLVGVPLDAPNSPTVVFTIQGWDLDRFSLAPKHVVSIYLSNSWRSSWL
jgi:hypothetical protein